MRSNIYSIVQLVLVVLVLVASSGAQQIIEKYTVVQCRADQKLFIARMQDHGAMKHITYKQLDDWKSEMGDCYFIDPQFSKEYENTHNQAFYAQELRLMNFVKRHNLCSQFIVEDAQAAGASARQPLPEWCRLP